MATRILTFLSLVCLVGLIQAQTTLAASVEITNDGAEIRLLNTDRWIGLSDGAVTAFGAGDVLRTNALGRLWLHFGENAHFLVLPNSELRLDSYSTESLEITFQGIGIFEAEAFSRLEIHMQAIDVIAVEGNAALFSAPRQADVVTVAQGSTTVLSGEHESVIAMGEGFRDTDEGGTVNPITMPYSAARLIGELDGCTGIVDTGELQGVRVRTGAGRGYQQRGLIDNGAEAVLLGQTETSGWTRIQFASGFAWITAYSLQSDCVLPILPNDSPEEDLTRVVNADERELDLLAPYFGSPLFDGFFYGFER